ncbi:MAG: aminotransferase class V-fold PLP-dependent enzyme [Streptosporangiales bacterium]|nr:aminotransferase class V-fold PLP-dependent enzyme [Streptosporangiales bacterium]
MTAPGLASRQAWFPALGDRRAYLDTATKGVPPAPAVEAVHDAVARWSSGTADHDEWDAAAESARGAVATILAARTYDVALVSSHVGAASTVARRHPDATVVVPAEEYRSNLLPWTLDRERVRLVPEPATTEAICAAVDEGADLVALSSMQSATGLRVDVPAVVAHAHTRGALVYVDASQSLGVDATLADSGADFVGAVAYKWLLGARGSAFLFVRPEHQTRFGPVLAGSPSASDGAYYGAGHRLWDDARRFDQPNAWLTWVATAAGLAVLGTYRTADLDAHATGLATRLLDGIGGLGLRHGIVDLESAIVSVAHPDPVAAAAALAAGGIAVAARRGGLRVAFHLYNEEHDVERTLAALHAAAR